MKVLRALVITIKLATILLIVAWIVLHCCRAWALPAGASITNIEPWDEYGTQSDFHLASPPYVFIDTATSQIVCGQTVPWKVPGTGATGCYLKMTPSGHGGENPGPTVATKAGLVGNPSQSWVYYRYYRAEVAPGARSAIYLFCDSTNPQGARGTDQFYLALGTNGQLTLLNSSNVQLGNSSSFKITFGTAQTNWYLFEFAFTVGANSANSFQVGKITLSVFNSTGLKVDSFGCNSCATTASNSSLAVDQFSADGEFDTGNSLVEDFGLAWSVNPGPNSLTASLTGPQYSYWTLPSGDSSPLQYSPTGVTSHFQASNVPPDPTKYVSTSTQGNQDTYSANFPNDFDAITALELISSQESTAIGVRLGSDFMVSPGSVTSNGSQCSLTNGTYGFCFSVYPGTFMPTNFGPRLGL